MVWQNMSDEEQQHYNALYSKVLTPVWLEEYNGEDKEKEHSSADN